MIVINGINDIGRGRYIIHYSVPSPCGCSFTRKTLITVQKAKPTDTKARKLIEDELKNKG